MVKRKGTKNSSIVIAKQHADETVVSLMHKV